MSTTNNGTQKVTQHRGERVGPKLQELFEYFAENVRWQMREYPTKPEAQMTEDALSDQATDMPGYSVFEYFAENEWMAECVLIDSDANKSFEVLGHEILALHLRNMVADALFIESRGGY